MSNKIQYSIFQTMAEGKGELSKQYKQQKETKMKQQIIDFCQVFYMQSHDDYNGRISNIRSFQIQQLTLRGGGTGSSQLKRKNTQNFQIPPDFITNLEEHIKKITSKAQLSRDESQKEEILISIQWFGGMKKYLDSLCQDASTIYDLLYKELPHLIYSASVLIKISGFLCLQVLEIINDLARVLFSFFMTNKSRFFKVEYKKYLQELLSDFETQLEIEQSHIWIAGVEFEIELIKAVIENSPSNSDEGSKLLINFIGGLAKSILTMSPSSDLIEAMLGGASFLHRAYKANNLKKKYEIYYFFESLKWQIIHSLEDQKDANVVKRVLKLISRAYQQHIAKSSDVVINYCWIKFVSYLLSYRPCLYKNDFNFSQWDELVKKKLIKLVSFDKTIGRVVFMQEEVKEFQEIQYHQRIQISNFQQFHISFLQSLKTEPKKALVIKDEQELDQKQQDYFKQYILEDQELEIEIGSFGQFFKKQFNEFKNLYTDFKVLVVDEEFQKQKIDDIIKSTKDLNESISTVFLLSDSIQMHLSLQINKLILIITSIKLLHQEQEYQDPLQHDLLNEAHELKIIYSEECCKQNYSLQIERQSAIESFIILAYKFEQLYSKLDIVQIKQIAKQQYEVIDTFIKQMDTLKKSWEKLILKIKQFKEKHKIKKYRFIFEYDLEDSQNQIKSIIISIINQNKLSYQMQSIAKLYETNMRTDHQNIFFKLVSLRLLQQLVLHAQKQIEQQKLKVQTTMNFLIKNIQSIIKQKIMNKSIQRTLSQSEIDDAINMIIQNQCLGIRQFLQEFNKDKNGKKCRVDELLAQLNQNIQDIKCKNNKRERKMQILILNCTLIYQEILFLMKNPDNFEQIEKQILSLLDKNQSMLIQQNIQQQQIVQHTEEQLFSRSQQEIIIVQRVQNTENTIVEQNKEQQNIKDFQLNLCFSVLFQTQILEKTMECCTRIQEVTEQTILLYEQAQEILQYIETKENNDIQENSLLDISEFVIQKYQSLKLELSFIEQEKFIFQEIQQANGRLQLDEAISDVKPIQILLSFFEEFKGEQFQLIETYQGESEKTISNSLIQNPKDFLNDYNYKIRQCLVVNLMMIEAAQLEQKVLDFCQENILQIWAFEKDQRVKELLRNEEMIKMQKKLFSHDLKTFSDKLQLKMKQQFQKMNDLQQQIVLEGDPKLRENLQKELDQQHQQFEEYLDSISDMSAKLDINLGFLKEIKKDLTIIKQKIDKLQEQICDIGDDIRKLRGKKFMELFQIRKRKVLDQKLFRDLSTIYIPLHVQEWDPISGNKIEGESFLLMEEFNDQNGEVNEFLTQKDKDVMLIRGYAGSGKSRAAQKIEEFLWEKQDKNQSDWIPIFISLPNIREPKFNLIDQALKSEYYQFDNLQIKEFKEALEQQKIRVIFILDSYDEMKQSDIQQNLYKTNRFSADLVGEIYAGNDLLDQFKVIITTRTEILNSQSYQTWFYGQSLKQLKEIELKGFDKQQSQEYLIQFVFLSVEKELYELYEFIKQVTKEKVDLHEFSLFWKQIIIYIQKEKLKLNEKEINQEYFINDEQANKIIGKLKEQDSFKSISSDQTINLYKKLTQLWSQKKYENLIVNTNIYSLLTTPFMMEIVVQVLPTIISIYSDATLLKNSFIKKFTHLMKQQLEEQQLIKQYQQQRQQILEQTNQPILECLPLENIDFVKLATQQWDQLESSKFFQKLQFASKIKDDQLQDIPEAKLIIKAFQMNTLTVFDFYKGFIDYYHHRQIDKLKEQGKVINYDAFILDLHNFSQYLALDMTINQLTQIKYDSKGQLNLKRMKRTNSIDDDWKDDYFNDFTDNGDYKKLIRSCSLLTQKGSSYSFTHKSIQEFFVAFYIWIFLNDKNIGNLYQLLQNNTQNEQKIFLEETLNNLEDQLFNSDKFNLSSDNYSGVLRIMKNKMKQTKNLKQKLIDLVKLSQMSSKYIRTASNSIFLLSFNNEYLGNEQFKGIQLSDTSIQGLTFFKSNLENSEFYNVNISATNFNAANLKNVKWKKLICNELPMLIGHTDEVSSVAFSPDGQMLASGSGDKKVGLWNIKTGTLLFSLEGHEKKVTTVSFSPNGILLASGSLDQTIHLWNVKQQQQKAILNGQCPIKTVAFSIDSLTLASGGFDSYIRLWDIQTLTQIAILKAHRESIHQLVFSTDGQILISCSQDRRIRLWDLKNYTPFVLEENRCCSHLTIAISPDSKILATGKEDFELELWDLQNKKLITIIIGHSERICSVEFSPDGQMLASGSSDCTIRFWDVKTFKLIALLEGHTDSVRSIAFSPDGQILASCSNDDPQIRLWDVRVGKEESYLEGHSSTVNSVVFSPDGLKIVSCSEDHTVQLWDVKEGKSISVLEGKSQAIRKAIFSPDGLLLVTCGEDNIIQIWETSSLDLFGSLEGHTDLVCSFAFSYDGSLLASCSRDEKIIIWQIKTLQEVYRLNNQQKYLQSVAFSPDNCTLAFLFLNGLELWDLNSKQVIFYQKGTMAQALQYSLNGKILAFARNDYSIQLLYGADEKHFDVLKGHSYYLYDLQFTQNS